MLGFSKVPVFCVILYLRTATHDYLYLVHIEGCNLQGPDISPSTTEDRRRMGHAEHTVQMQDHFIQEDPMKGSRDGSVLTELMSKWALPSKLTNPPNINQVNSTLPYLRQYAVDMAYVTSHCTDETRKQFKRRKYAVLLCMAEPSLGTSEPRIVRKHQESNWKHIWTILHATGVTDTLKSTWYTVIHDLIPANDRLVGIHLKNTHTCSRCGQPDSLQHRITDCEEGPIIWKWTPAKLGLILRMDSQHITRT